MNPLSFLLQTLLFYLQSSALNSQTICTDQLYQSGRYFPCIEQLCDFSKGFLKQETFYQLQFRLLFNDAYLQIPKFQLSLGTMNNTKDATFFIDSPNADLIGVSFTFSVLIKSSLLNFTINWIASLEKSIHFIEAEQNDWGINKTYVLKLPFLFDAPIVLKFIGKISSTVTRAFVSSITQQEILLVSNYNYFEQICLIVMDSGTRFSDNRFMLYNQNQLKVESSIGLYNYSLTQLEIDQIGLVYGISDFISGDQFILDMYIEDNIFIINHDKWTSLQALNITIFISKICFCETGYYEKNKTCQKCQFPCNECTNIGTNCTSCPINYEIKNFTCVCQTGYFQQNQLCQPCLSPCLECLSQLECLLCNGSLGLYMTNKSCFCKLGQLYSKIKGCFKPNKLCTNYDQKGCIQCQRNATLYDFDCFCNQGYYESNQQCEMCGKQCLKCNNSTVCLKCDKLTSLNQGLCVCQQGYFLENDSCVQCSIRNCISCTGRSKCISCTKDYQLNRGKCVKNKKYVSKNDLPSSQPILNNVEQQIQSNLESIHLGLNKFERYQQINLGLTILAVISNAQVIAQLQFLNYVVPENVYLLESIVSSVTLSKQFPEWQENPVNCSQPAWINRVYQYQNCSSYIPIQFSRISFTLRILPNLSYAVLALLIFLTGFLLKQIFSLFKSRTFRFFNHLYPYWIQVFQMFLEGTYSIFGLTLYLNTLYFLKSFEIWQFADLLFLIFLTICYTIMTCYHIFQIRRELGNRRYQLIQNRDLLLQNKLANYGFYLNGINLDSKGVYIVFYNLIKKNVFMFLIVLLHGNVQMAVFFLMNVQFVFIGLTLHLTPFQKKITSYLVVTSYCFILIILTFKTRNYFFYQNIKQTFQPTELVHQYYREGWALVVIEVIFLLIGIAKLIIQFICRILESRLKPTQFAAEAVE